MIQASLNGANKVVALSTRVLPLPMIANTAATTAESAALFSLPMIANFTAAAMQASGLSFSVLAQAGATAMSAACH